MDQRAMQLMTLNGQIKNLAEQNAQLRRQLGVQNMFEKFLAASITGLSSTQLSAEDIAVKAFAITDAVLLKFGEVVGGEPKKPE